MSKQLSSLSLTACVAAVLLVEMPNAQAKQCSAAMPSDPHGKWWSYRIIDGRKCWYEGKPMLSKASLEWPKEAAGKPGADREVKPASTREVASAATAKPGNLLDAQALALKDSDTFEARWRARVQGH